MRLSATQLSKYRLLALVSLAMVLLSLTPQIHLWIARGRDWNGAYVGPYGDELIYAGYVNALKNDRTRKNDPYWGQDNTSDSRLPESIFSIQFLPPYAIALVARALGLSVSTTFILLTACGALLATLAVYFLLERVTSDYRMAAAGTLFVLCVGCIGGRQSFFGTFFDVGFPALPFLRRYQPVVAFPFFFIFQLLVWSVLTSKIRGKALISATLAGFTLATLVFSYLYLWTAAAAWLVCIIGLWLYLRPTDRIRTIKLSAIILTITGFALAPYAYMISHRATTLDEQQILASTRTPDLFRFHEIVGALILVSLVIGIRRRRFSIYDPRVIYAASLATLPFLVFNQQILSGISMQPFHFENFSVNYSSLLGLLIPMRLFWRTVSRRILLGLALGSLLWGLVVVAVPSKLIFVPWAISNDKRIPVLRRLEALSTQDGTLADLRNTGRTTSVVFSPIMPLIALMPTWTSQGALIDVTGSDSRGQTRLERKEFLYMHLYYSKTDGNALRRALNNEANGSRDELSNVRQILFGHERVFQALSSHFESIEAEEVEREVKSYDGYINSFSREEALKRPLTYAVIPTEGQFDFTNLDRWYERDAGERVGDYVLYRLKLRP